jgi:hypothetical protein
MISEKIFTASSLPQLMDTGNEDTKLVNADLVLVAVVDRHTDIFNEQCRTTQGLRSFIGCTRPSLSPC